MTLISPRQNEIDAVINILESPLFESPEAMARAIVVTVAGELSHRTTKGIAAGFPGEGPVMAVGPFYDSRDVEKWRQEAQEAGLETRVARLSSPDALLSPEAATVVSCECGHQKEQHVVKVRGDKVSAPQDCGVMEGKSKCPCGTFTRKAS